ncbi:MAG TPA: hypothetical protein VII96_05820 [Acidimicrobiales bacterium]
MAGREGAGDPTAVKRSSSRLVRGWRSTVRGARGLRDVADMRLDPTYRRLAAGYRLPDGSRRVYLHHIRKTAGTSMFLSFLALGGEDPMAVWHRINAARLPRTVSGGYAFVSIHRKLLAEGAYFFGRAHRPVEDQPLPEGTFTVTVLRDPVSRVHSYFDYLVVGDTPDTPGRVNERERRIALDGFDAFLDRVPPRHLLSQLHTFSTALDVSAAAERVAACSAVYFTERYAEGLAALSTRLEVPLAVHRARATGSRSTLTPAQTDRLREVLEPEYQLLARLDDAGIGGRAGPI